MTTKDIERRLLIANRFGGETMEDTYLRTLECECSNKGVAVYSGTGTTRKLYDLAGDFRRADDSDDPPIYCDFCKQAVARRE